MLAVILAGGKSQRMGQDKSTLPFCGTNLLHYQAVKFSEAGFQVAVSQKETPGYLTFPDQYHGRGPMAGLHAAFSQTEAACLFLLAVDLPAADPSLAWAMAAYLQPEDDICVLRRQNGRVEPLFAFYRRSCLPAAERLLKAGNGKMRLLLEQVHTHFLDANLFPAYNLDQVLYNMNDPADYAACSISHNLG